MLRILVADDHAVVRRGIKQILEEDLEIETIAEAQNAEEALALVRAQEWDIVILDLNMPGRSGLEVLTELLYYKPHLPVLILSMHPEDQVAVRVLKAGASGYMTKDSAPEELVNAIRKIRGGGRYISPALAETLVFSLQNEVDKPLHEALSHREFEVMRLIARGKPLSQIAGELCLSVKTISTYRTRLLEKLALQSNADITRYALQHHLLD
ncbi:MAG TPA: response regulator transcription factor [Chthonomonadaceae bacterium]|nr:response regulator transcription factor [Chthonomonadaceae bacterium]